MIHVVLNEHTLGTLHPEQPVMVGNLKDASSRVGFTCMGVLGRSIPRGGRDPSDGTTPISIGRDNLRLATEADFAEYRVASRGHLEDMEALSEGEIAAWREIVSRFAESRPRFIEELSAFLDSVDDKPAPDAQGRAGGQHRGEEGPSL